MESCSTSDSTETLSLLKTDRSQLLPLWKRVLYLTWVFFECLLFSGGMYGWASLVYILKYDGIYADLCDNDPNNSSGHGGVNDSWIFKDGGIQDTGVVCHAQDSEFDLVFTIASSAGALTSLLTGHINFKYGTRITRILSIVLFMSGSLLLAFESKELPWLVFPGLTLLGIGGIPLLVTSTQISNLFPRHSSAVVGLLNGAFDASAGVLLVVKIAFDNGISRKNCFLFLTGLNVTVLVSTFIIYPRWFIKKQKPYKKGDPDDEVNANQVPEKELSIEASQSQTNVKESMMSPIFIFHLVWFSILFLHFTYFVSSLNSWLNHVLHRDREKVSYYTNVHLYSLMPAIIVAWLAGLVFDGAKRFYRDDLRPLRGKIRASVVPLTMTSISAVLVSLLMLSPEESVLYVTFIAVMVFRAFLYATASSFLIAVFPLEQFGILYSASLISAGALAFLQYAMFMWTQYSDFNTVNKFLAGMAAFTLVHPLYQYVSCARSSRSRRHYDKI
ncbi:equilibrative nucleobase transporter 1-like isoform X2 [Haliotis rufescens]|uniref:equilibrative nucleobase transporter 1-like isoform X2 n=1 Tax=Haliotis rufescens TaxID=6454 RepID=UPI00201F6799|nr:equilibrative nucleobase transporter 1-like isoform X2 [Haliotis rufescens]